mmetsp:Transcript_8811/g.37259  ORF Transcript_8811/g.37259 Transcript_8811/m.37259 type:complete len:234 (-) Transcript_8811:1336-2037(-)
MSTMRLGPVVSGPKHQIFLDRSLSQPNFSARNLPRALGSSRGVTSPASIASDRPSSRGCAWKYRRLCLFGDLDMRVSDEPLTDSRNETTGSEMRISAPPMKSSCRSLRQISRCSSPAPATMCSPVSSIWHSTMGSDLDRRLRPSTSLGRSCEFLHSTATRTTGETENFIALSGCASVSASPVSVAFLEMNWSRPTMATVLPEGTSSTASWRRPMQMTVRWMDLTYRSFFSPGT